VRDSYYVKHDLKRIGPFYLSAPDRDPHALSSDRDLAELREHPERKVSAVCLPLILRRRARSGCQPYGPSLLSSTSRSLRANSSGLPAYPPISGPTNPPWWLGKTVAR
jgi:hypothetical protein